MSTEPKPEPSDLQRLIATFAQHERYCAVCQMGQRLCEMGEALMTGLAKAAIKESKAAPKRPKLSAVRKATVEPEADWCRDYDLLLEYAFK